MAGYYVLVLIPDTGKKWIAQFPDIPGCRAMGEQVEALIRQATSAASAVLRSFHNGGTRLPPPRSFEEVRADTVWAEERAIDWSKAIVSLVAVG